MGRRPILARISLLSSVITLQSLFAKKVDELNVKERRYQSFILHGISISRTREVKFTMECLPLSFLPTLTLHWLKKISVAIAQHRCFPFYFLGFLGKCF